MAGRRCELEAESTNSSDGLPALKLKRAKYTRFDSSSDLSSQESEDVVVTAFEAGPNTVNISSSECSQSSSEEGSNTISVKVLDISKSPVKKKIEKKRYNLLHGRKELPIYSTSTKLLSTKDCIDTLLNSELPETSICSQVPFSVGVNALFIIDLSKLKSTKDVLCDDMGTWKWNGSFHKWCLVGEGGFVKIMISKADSVESCYRIWKRYYFLQASPDVKKMVVMLEDSDEQVLNLALVQYVFKEGEHEVKAAPHLNSKSREPYHRTMPSVMKTLKEQSKQTTAKRVLQFVRKESGGMLEASSAGALPRGRQQVNDLRKNRRESDPLYTLMLMCKEAESSEEGVFIRQVNAAPYTMVVLASDYTLDDLVRFCTNPNAFSILNVDPTFNLGPFDVTVTTYRHMLLRNAGNPRGKPPIMLGPLFIHLKKDFSAYHFFSSSLISANKELRYVQAIGTDGEAALVNAMETSFPHSIQLRCFLHFKGNIERKLRSLGLPNSVVDTIVNDVMGYPTQLQLGLVDAENPCELDKQLKQAESRWNALEQPYRNPPKFHKWFMRYCSKPYGA